MQRHDHSAVAVATGRRDRDRLQTRPRLVVRPSSALSSRAPWSCIRANRQPGIREVLDGVDMLIDGPYGDALAGSAGPWMGSGNQRVIDLAVTRRRAARARPV